VLGSIGDKDRYEDLVHLSSEVDMTIGTFRVPDLEELIRQKKATDRPKDRAVIELLEEALHHQRNEDRHRPSEGRGHRFDQLRQQLTRQRRRRK
jgi:hypothetical protein